MTNQLPRTNLPFALFRPKHSDDFGIAMAYGFAMLANMTTAARGLRDLWSLLRRGSGLALVLLHAALTGAGVESTASVADFTVDIWQVEQGLPHISVTSIAQTPDGYLWLGTFNGLVRFDGVRFTVFNAVNMPALGSSRITHLDLDPSGGLWIVTEAGGLARMVQGRCAAYGRKEGLPESGARTLVRDLRDRFFLLDREGGFRRIQDGRLLSVDSKDHLLSAEDPGLLFENTGGVWVTRRGKVTISTEAEYPVRVLSGTNTIPTNVVISCAIPCRSGGHWVMTPKGLCRLLEGQISAPLGLAAIGGKGIRALTEDSQGNCWAGEWGKALTRWDMRGGNQTFVVGAGLADNQITCLFSDREGSLWVGTDGGGLHRFKPRLFRMYDTRDGLEGNLVTSLAEDRKGRIWIGVNGGGLHTWDSGRITRITEPARLRRHPLVYSVLPDREDGIWIGLYARGALRLRDGSLTPYTVEEGFLQNTVLVFLQDRAGRIWLGGDRGLLRFDGGQFTREDNLSHDEVSSLVEDRFGTIYIGTRGGGLNCLRDGRFTALVRRKGLPDNHISSLYVDGEDTLWIGTANGGLCRFKESRFATFGTKDGLPSDTIGSVIEDNLGNLWLGSNRGIIRLCRRELNRYLDGQRPTLSCDLFGQSDGLGTVACVAGGQPSCWKARDGRLWFATAKGAAVVDPKRIPFNPLPPTVVIEEVVSDEGASPSGEWIRGNGQEQGSSVPGPGGRTMSHSADDSRFRNLNRRPGEFVVLPGHHRLEIRFTGLSLLASEKVRFRHQLEGLDKDWIEAGSQRVATYAYIPPGQYRFRVTACNNDGVWNEAGAMLPITVLPSVWQTNLFKGLVLLGLVGGAGWLTRFGSLWWVRQRLERLERQHALENERSRIARDIHDDLGARLTQIGLLSELAKRSLGKTEEARSYLEKIIRRSRETSQAMDEIVWTVDPAKDTLEDLMNYLAPMSEELFLGSDIHCRLDLPPVMPPQPISAKTRHSILMVVKEALNNCLKHSAATEVWVRCRFQGTILHLEIEDNGSGLATHCARSDHPGHGLQNMRRRMENLGGSFEVLGEKGRGTTIRVELELARNV